MALQKSTPPFPVDPDTNTLHLPSEVVHELFHLVKDDQKVEAVNRVMELTGASQKTAQAYVDTLLQRR
jgi:hypothetical protein